MKRIAAIALFAAATLVTTGTALAQNQAVKANVPFNFYVNGAWLPAGTYIIGSQGIGNNEIQIANREKQAGALALGMVDANDPANSGELVFHRYGESYFLSEVRYSHSSTKVHLSASKAEKQARERAIEANLRVNDNVEIAMN